MSQWLQDIGKGNLLIDTQRLDDALDWTYAINQRNLLAETPAPYVENPVEGSEYDENDLEIDDIFGDVDDTEDPDDPNKNTHYFQPINLLVVGQPGGGKTSIIEQWGKHRKVILKKITGGELTDTMVQGLPFATEIPDTEHPEDETKNKKKQLYLPSTMFDDLDIDVKITDKYSVLFLDELNRSYSEVEASLLTLIQSHDVPDINYANGRRYLHGFLFTVAAINPPDSNKEAERLSAAMTTRFMLFEWHSDPKETADFWTKVYNSRLSNLKR